MSVSFIVWRFNLQIVFVKLLLYREFTKSVCFCYCIENLQNVSLLLLYLLYRLRSYKICLLLLLYRDRIV